MLLPSLPSPYLQQLARHVITYMSCTLYIVSCIDIAIIIRWHACACVKTFHQKIRSSATRSPGEAQENRTEHQEHRVSVLQGFWPFRLFCPLGTHLLNFLGNTARAVPRGYRAAAAEAPAGTPEVAAAGAPPARVPAAMPWPENPMDVCCFVR